MKGLNLSKFHKVSSDKNITTLSHEDGHIMKILHSAVSPIQREQLKRLPGCKDKSCKHYDEGGEVSPEPKQEPTEAPKEERKPLYKKPDGPWNYCQKCHNKHSGCTCYDDGGTVDAPAPTSGPSIDPDKAKKFMKGFQGATGFYKGTGDVSNDDGSDDSSSDSSDDDSDSSSSTHSSTHGGTHIIINAAPAPQATAAAPAQPQPDGHAPEAPVQDDSGTKLLNNDQTLNAPAAVGMQQQAIQAQSKIDQQKAQGTVPLEEQGAQNASEIQDRQDQTIQDMKQHTDDFAAHMRANPINASAYQESQTDQQKSSTALGLLLGGLGGGGRGNMALDALNKNIDRNIEAQKENRDNAKTIFGAYQQLYGDENVSTALTKVTMNDRLIHQANVLSAQLGTPQAKQKALELTAQKGIENSQLINNAAALSGSMGGGSSSAPSPITTPNIYSGAVKNPSALEKQRIDEYKSSHILTPDVNKKMTQLGFKGSPFENDYPEFRDQVTQAQQAEKAISQVNDAFPRLAKNSTVAGRIARLGGGALAGIGGALGAAVGHPGIGAGLGSSVSSLASFGNDNNKAYEAEKTTLVKNLAAALPNFGAGAIEQVVDKNTPEQGDSPELIEEKRKNIVNFLKSKVQTSMLSKHNVLIK